MRFELTTLTLARLCSTPELRPRAIGKRPSIQPDRDTQEGAIQFFNLPRGDTWSPAFSGEEIDSGGGLLEASTGIEPVYTDLQSAA